MTTNNDDIEALGAEALPAGFAEILLALQPLNANSTGTLLTAPAEATLVWQVPLQQTTDNSG